MPRKKGYQLINQVFFIQYCSNYVQMVLSASELYKIIYEYNALIKPLQQNNLMYSP